MQTVAKPFDPANLASIRKWLCRHGNPFYKSFGNWLKHLDREPTFWDIDKFMKNKQDCYKTLGKMLRQILPHYEMGKSEPVNYNNDIPIEITTDGPKLPYAGRNGKYKHPCHAGQRKLLLSELYAICTIMKNIIEKHGPQDKFTILYVGAAPGEHIAILNRLFSNINWILWDPAPIPFSKQLINRNNIEIHQECFNIEHAKYYGEKYRDDIAFIYIDDARRVPEKWDLGNMSQQLRYERRLLILEDNRLKCQWLRMVNKPSLIKYAVPYPWTELLEYGGISEEVPEQDNYAEFPSGAKILVQPRIGPTATECRAFYINGPEPGNFRMNCSEYEELLYYFNLEIRNKTFYADHNIRLPGICHCWDCCREIQIVVQYLKLQRSLNKDNSPICSNEVAALIQRFSKKDLLLGNHGAWPWLENAEQMPLMMVGTWFSINHRYKQQLNNHTASRKNSKFKKFKTFKK